MISINNVKMPSPSSYTPNLMDITKGERNSKGTMFIDLITKKWKLELTWGILTQEEMRIILKELESGVTFEVTFIDLYGDKQTRKFYKGDRKAGMILIKDGAVIWKDFSVNLIEV